MLTKKNITFCYNLTKIYCKIKQQPEETLFWIHIYNVNTWLECSNLYFKGITYIYTELFTTSSIHTSNFSSTKPCANEKTIFSAIKSRDKQSRGCYSTTRPHVEASVKGKWTPWEIIFLLHSCMDVIFKKSTVAPLCVKCTVVICQHLQTLPYFPVWTAVGKRKVWCLIVYLAIKFYKGQIIPSKYNNKKELKP